MMLDNPIANRFSVAASRYKQHDVLQRITADYLCAMVDLQGTLLDVGAGPGTCFSLFDEVKHVVAVDIAHGMLSELSQRFNDYLPLCSDAQALGLQTASINCIYSNLALQWCHNLPQAINEFHRVLQPGGECALSMVAHGSLPELQALGFRINAFNTLTEILATFQPRNVPADTAIHWHVEHAQIDTVTLYFDDLRSLLYSIKGVGASLPSPLVYAGDDKPSTTISKPAWRQRVALAETMRTDKGLPLTYHIAYIRAKRG